MRERERLTILGEQLVRPPNDKGSDQGAEFLELLFTFRLDSIRSIRIASSNDYVLKVPAEVGFGAQEIGVGKVKQREVFGKVVLDRSTGENNSSLDLEACESGEGERIAVLQSVTFVADKQTDL